MISPCCGRDHVADREREHAQRDAMAPGTVPYGVLLRLEELGWRLEREEA